MRTRTGRRRVGRTRTERRGWVGLGLGGGVGRTGTERRGWVGLELGGGGG